MFAYGLVAVAVFTVLATTLFRRSKADCLHGPAFIDDVPTTLKHAAVQKRPLWEVFDALAKRYGSIYSFRLRGKPVVVLNSAMLGRDLLEKKGDIYSGRPRMVIAHEILSGGMRGLSSPYNSFWKKWRKIQYIGMSGRACLAYREHQTLEAAVLVRDIYRNADEYRNIIQRFAASIVLSISYGRRVTSLQDKAVVSNVHAIEELQRYATPGKYLVDAWPILLWLPRPLQWFRREADRQRASDSKFYMSLVQEVRQRMDAGRQKECLTSRALKSGYEDLTDLELAYCVAAPFGGGVDTTSSSIEYAILSAMLFPLQAQKAQAELDRIVGRDRLPTFEDQAALPYVGAYIKELERWRPIVPLAVPHAVTRDDNFEGNWIPKGTTVYANIYTMMQDPELFSDPEEFRPQRFLPREDGTLDARFRDFMLPFGFGRRQCPAHIFAYTS
ncbi:cytochrome P450 [Amylostereum chailletii]|nr:cytochrome P450 [Amylostereum chailletii]